MERLIFFGCVRNYYDSNGNVTFCVEYMTDDGFIHRDKINERVYNLLLSYNTQPGTAIIGKFEVDGFNTLKLSNLSQA